MGSNTQKNLTRMNRSDVTGANNLLLAIETTSPALSLAVQKLEENSALPLSQTLLNAGLLHAEKLQEISSRALADAGGRLDQVRAVAVSKGPASNADARNVVSRLRRLMISVQRRHPAKLEEREIPYA